MSRVQIPLVCPKVLGCKAVQWSSSWNRLTYWWGCICIAIMAHLCVPCSCMANVDCCAPYRFDCSADQTTGHGNVEEHRHRNPLVFRMAKQTFIRWTPLSFGLVSAKPARTVEDWMVASAVEKQRSVYTFRGSPRSFDYTPPSLVPSLEHAPVSKRTDRLEGSQRLLTPLMHDCSHS